MSDQEATPTTPAASDERPQQRTNQPEQRDRQRERDRGGRRRHPQQSQPQQQQQRRPEPSLNMEELRELVELIAQSGFTDFELEREGIRIRLRRQVSAPDTASSAAPSSPASTLAPAAPTVPTTSTGQGAQTTSSSVAATSSTAAQPAVAEPAKAAGSDEDLHVITSPIVGTFYRSPSPTAEPFVRLGSHVDPDTVVCIIEAMKLMNEIQAETSGEVAKIYVENGQPVEYGQPLFGIKR